MRVRCTLPALALALVAVALPARIARGEGPPSYGPVPAGISALVGTTWEEALAERAAGALEGESQREAETARAELLLAGDAGLKHVVTRLASGRMGDRARLLALQVVAASPRPEVDEVLSRAVEEPRFEARAVAAHGLAAGRTALAVEALSALARDAAPVVRGAALRALFAIDTPSARAVRIALPVDVDARLVALRLRLHRLRDDAAPELTALSTRVWASRSTPGARLEAARLLVRPVSGATESALAAIVLEFGGYGAASQWVRRRFSAPLCGYDPAAERTVATEALLAWLSRPGIPAARRELLAEVAVSWLTRHERIGGRSVDAEARTLLLAALPDLGAPIVRPVVENLLSDAFEEAREGVRLLDALDPVLALPALARLVDPASKAPEDVVEAASGAFRDLGRVGDEAIARSLVAKDRPCDVRTDGLVALRGEPAEVALPLLVAALSDEDDAVASTAATILSDRREPEARAAIEASLLDSRVRPYETDLLRRFGRRPDEDAWRMFERAMRNGPRDLRVAIFDVIREPRSGLRGERAKALVRIPMADPRLLGLDVVKIASALSSVDGPAAVAYVREHLPKVAYPVKRVILRDLQVVAEPEAREFALEVAASLPDSEEGLLCEVTTVLAGRTERDAGRTDPFWRRLLKIRGVLRGVAVEALAKADPKTREPDVPRGDLSRLLVPIVADLDERVETVREDALRALVLGPYALAEDFLFQTATDPRHNPEGLSLLAAEALVGHARPDTRAKALQWLKEPPTEVYEILERVGRVAGKGASPAEAATILSMLDQTFASWDRSAAPYWMTLTETQKEQHDAYMRRVRALLAALVEADDETTLSALAERLFKPRFTAEAAGALRRESSWFSGGGDALSPIDDPPPLEVLLHRGEERGLHSPLGATGEEPSEIVGALKKAAEGGPEREARVAEWMRRAIASARTRGDLAQVPALYLHKIATRWRARGKNEPRCDGSAAAAAVEEAAKWVWPAEGPVAYAAALARVNDLLRAGRIGEAAAAQASAVSLGARTGIVDIPPVRWIDRGNATPPSWRLLEAYADLLEGAAAAVEGRAEEARAAFRRGLAREPLDARTHRDAARLRATVGLDLEAAAADARRAASLDRRQGESRPVESDPTLAWILAVKARGAAPAPPAGEPGDDADGD